MRPGLKPVSEMYTSVWRSHFKRKVDDGYREVKHGPDVQDDAISVHKSFEQRDHKMNLYLRVRVEFGPSSGRVRSCSGRVEVEFGSISVRVRIEIRSS